MKHTQGTWEANSKLTIQVNPENPVETTTICQVYGSGEQSEANARLIAAAPELLRALKACARHLNTNNEIDRVLYEIAIEAINKATQDS